MKTEFKFRRVAALSLPVLCWGLVASTTACGDDDDSGDAGTSGSSTAGKASAGNSTGGKAMAGSASGGGAGKSAGGNGMSGSSNPPPGGEGGGAEPPLGGEGGMAQGVGGEGGVGGEPPLVVVPDPHDSLPNVFNYSKTGHNRFFNTTFDAAGNAYAVGQITLTPDATGNVLTIVAKFKPTGELDTTFGDGGFYKRDVVTAGNAELLRGIVVQSDGKIVVSGAAEHLGMAALDKDIFLIRINADGTTDTTFGEAGRKGLVTLDLSAGTGTNNVSDSGWGLAKYPGSDDRLVLSGGRVRKTVPPAADATDSDFVIVRLTANGVLDTTFSGDGIAETDTALPTAVPPVEHNNASPRNVTILPGTDGILGAGYQPKPGFDTSPVVYKIKDDGAKDSTFGDNGVFHTALLDEQTESYSAVVQPNAGGVGYKLITTGYGRKTSADKTDFVSLRLTSDGQIDETYGDKGIVQIDVGGFNDNSRNLTVLPDRRIVMVGGGRLTDPNVDAAIIVLSPDGAPDPSWGPKGYTLFDLGGPADFFWGVAQSPDHTKLAFAGILGVGAAPVAPSVRDGAYFKLIPTP